MDIGNVAVEVPRDHGEHPGNERGAQDAGFFAQRVAEGHNEARLRRGERSFRGGAEAAANGFVETCCKQSGAYSKFAGGPGQRADALTKSGQRVCKSVVAVDACYFFDEIDFAL
jgi:hypothetical protein